MDRSEVWWARKGTKNQRQSMQSKSDNSKNVHIRFGWHVLMCLPWKTETSISPNANALIWFGTQLSKTQFGSQSHFFRDCDARRWGFDTPTRPSSCRTCHNWKRKSVNMHHTVNVRGNQCQKHNKLYWFLPAFLAASCAKSAANCLRMSATCSSTKRPIKLEDV